MTRRIHLYLDMHVHLHTVGLPDNSRLSRHKRLEKVDARNPTVPSQKLRHSSKTRRVQKLPLINNPTLWQNHNVP
jgi:hypothetical protein